MNNPPKDLELNDSNASACFTCEETKHFTLFDQLFPGCINKVLAMIVKYPLPIPI